MVETDDGIIEQLMKEYSQELPTRIDQMPSSLDSARLIERREKIANLLENAYGIPLATSSPGFLPTSVISERREKSTSHANMVDPETRQPGVVPLPRRSTRKGIDLERGEMDVEVRRRNQAEVAKSIASLRAEYNVRIPEKLASHLTEKERAAMLIRSSNIRKLLERGYKVTIQADE